MASSGNLETRHPTHRAAPRCMSMIALMLCMTLILGIYGMFAGAQRSCPTCGQCQSSSSSQLQRLVAATDGDDGDVQAAANQQQQQQHLEKRQLEQEMQAAPSLGDDEMPAPVAEGAGGGAGSNGGRRGAEPPLGQDDAYISMCTAIRDEHCDIREWVLHHSSLGVGKFYVFDTQSSEPMAPVLDDLVASGLVAYQYVTNTSADINLETPTPGRSYNWQLPIFTLCLKRYGARHRWMGFMDADEFVVPTGEGSYGGGGDVSGPLPALLRANEAHGGLVLHWQLFGFNGHIERPGEGVLASYTSCWPVNNGIHRHVKSFVQPAHVIKPETPHSFFYKPGYYAVDTNGVRVKGPIIRKGPITYRGAVLHHYISKSLADFEVKTARRGGAGSVKTIAHFLKWHRQSSEACTRAVPLGRELADRYDLQRNVPKWCLLPISQTELDDE